MRYRSMLKNLKSKTKFDYDNAEDLNVIFDRNNKN